MQLAERVDPGRLDRVVGRDADAADRAVALQPDHPALLRLRDERLLLRLGREPEDDVHDRAALPLDRAAEEPGVRVDDARRASPPSRGCGPPSRRGRPRPSARRGRCGPCRRRRSAACCRATCSPRACGTGRSWGCPCAPSRRARARRSRRRGPTGRCSSARRRRRGRSATRRTSARGSRSTCRTTSGAPPVGGNGRDGSTSNSTPWMVSFDVQWRYAARGVGFTSAGSGDADVALLLALAGPGRAGDVDVAVEEVRDRLRLGDRLLAPRAGHDVVRDRAVLEEVHRDLREQLRGAALEEEHLVRVADAEQLAQRARSPRRGPSRSPCRGGCAPSPTCRCRRSR